MPRSKRIRRAAPPPPPLPYHHGDLRRAILDEALALIEEQGHASFTLREVARRVGVSHAAPYRHFADKRALMTALATEAMRKLAAQISAALEGAGDDLRAQFLAAGFAYVRFALDSPASFRAMFSDELDLTDPELIAAKGLSFGLLLDFIVEAQRRGAFPPGAPEDLATPIWAMHQGLASLAAAGAFRERGQEGLRRVVDDAHARLLDGLLRAPPPLG